MVATDGGVAVVWELGVSREDEEGLVEDEEEDLVEDEEEEDDAFSPDLEVFCEEDEEELGHVFLSSELEVSSSFDVGKEVKSLVASFR